MIQFLYILISVTGLVYFYLTLNKINYFHVAYFSSVIYFLPAWLGFTSYHVEGIWYKDYIHDDVYLVMIMVLTSIFISGIVYSQAFQKQYVWGKTIEGEQYLPWVFLILALSGLVGAMIGGWGYISQPDKPLLMEHLGRSFILFYISSLLGFMVAFSERRKILTVLFFGLLLFNLYLGFRSTLGIAVIGAVMIWIMRSNKKGKLCLSCISILVMITGVAFLLYKRIVYPIKSGNYTLVVERLLNQDTYTDAIFHSEPFITQTILNEVIKTNYKGGIESLYGLGCQLVPIGGNYLGECLGFDQLYQPALFPEVTYGMGNNIWAQMWSIGGLIAVALFLLVYCGLIFVANFLLFCRSSAVKYGFIPASIYWVFYIHRNDLSFAISLEKRVIILLGLSIIISMLLAIVVKYGVNNQEKMRRPKPLHNSPE